jgi:exodeoxyribonuclease V alpha subunit
MASLESMPGIGPELARRVRNALGPKADSIVAANPYKLMDVWGIGWTKADTIAREVFHIEPSDPKRIKTGIDQWFEDQANRHGHSAAVCEEAIYGAREMLACAGAKSLPIAQTLYNGGWYIGKLLAAKWDMRRKEEYIARRLAAMVAPPELSLPCDTTGLFSDQTAALEGIQKSHVFALTGAPGVGKTATIKAVIRSNADARIVLCAPTGKAAKRMNEMTGYAASTMHRALDPKYDDDTGKFIFTRDENHPIAADLIVIDEMSMVDIWLMFRFLKAVDSKTRLLLVGDPYQLPSVGAGNVLGDIVASGRVPNLELRQIKRSNPDLLIARNCALIKDGRPPINQAGATDWFFFERTSPGEVANTIRDLVLEKLPAKFGADPRKDIQVITALNDRSNLSRAALNTMLREKLNPSAMGSSRPELGDRVICTKNDYGLGVYNGDIGTIIDVAGQHLKILFDGDDEPIECLRRGISIDLAYALTVHKAQGSEWPFVIVPIHKVLGPLVTRRPWLYTAASRARKATILVGSVSELAAIVSREQDTRRVTMLRGLLDGSDAISDDADRFSRAETLQPAE